jgi:hypothetical protein
MFTTKGLFRVKLGVSNEALLRSAGQPRVRGAFVWKWGIQKRPIKSGTVYAVLGDDGAADLVASTGLEHSADGVNVGDPADAVDAAAVRLGKHVRITTIGSKYASVYGIAGGKVVFTGVTSLRGKDLRAAVARLKLV